MRVPDKNTATRELTKLNTYTTAQLRADAETKDLAPPLDAAMAALLESDHQFEQREAALMAMMALRDRADSDADDLLRRLFRLIQGIEGGHGRGPMGRVVFPKGLVAVTNGPVRDQPGEMSIVAGNASATVDEQIASYAPALLEKAATLKNRNDEYEDSLGQVGLAFADVVRHRLDWIRSYEKTYGQLVGLMGKAKAERYFKKAAKAKKKKATPSA